MKISFHKKDVVFGGLLVIVLFIITSTGYTRFEAVHKYMDGFIKFSVLATMGELLSIRIAIGRWQKAAGIFWRVMLWGAFGIGVTLMFTLFSEGVIGAQRKGLLPDNHLLLTAFFASATMNATSGPVMMAMQRIGTTYIDLKYEQGKASLKRAVASVDWVAFLSLEVFITIPCIWIPANTVVFLMPEKMRILVAALLSMVLGLILTVGKIKSHQKKIIHN
ncbi:hypothetical protein QBE52_03000 [Clostridiaceae bacterium 35-E11]